MLAGVPWACFCYLIQIWVSLFLKELLKLSYVSDQISPFIPSYNNQIKDGSYIHF